MGDLHQLMMVDHIQEKLQASRQHLDNYRRKGLGMPDKAKSDEEMKVLASGDVHFTTNTSTPTDKSSPQGSGVGKVLAGAALAAGMLGVPVAGVAGYLLSQSLNKTDPPASSQAQSTEDNSLDIGLLKFDELHHGL